MEPDRFDRPVSNVFSRLRRISFICTEKMRKYHICTISEDGPDHLSIKLLDLIENVQLGYLCFPRRVKIVKMLGKH
jgi:hypothetical protein